MLEDRLQQASEVSTRDRKRILLLAAIGALVAVAVMLMLSFYQHAPSRSITPAISPHAARPVQPSPHPLPHPVKTQTADDQSGLREQFMAALQAYQSGLETALAGAHLDAWDSKQANELSVRKQAAVSAFGEGEYATALQHLNALESMAKQTLAKRDALFSREIEAVKQALGSDDAVAARLHITKALQVKPDDPQAQALEQQALALPTLLDLLKKAAIAQTENNPEQELVWLHQAIQIAPHRDGLKQRRDALVIQIRQSQFSKLIANGLSAVAASKLTAARLNYKKANALDAGRPELRVLQAAIRKLSDTLALKHALTEARKAIAADDWRRARSAYAEAAKRFPDHSDIHDGLQLADNVVSLQTAVADYLARPERLSSSHVSAAARNMLIQARVLADNSPSLARNVTQLEQMLNRANIKIPVLVTSDNHTFVRVRGVGKVGVTLSRTIHLKPGNYIFEGIRAGYKSKLVRFRVQPIGKQSLAVRVVCDERI